MYNTVKEMHIALDERLQQFNSNRKLALQPEQKDLRLNEAQIQFIDKCTSRKLNIKKEGFQESQKRIDDIQELVRYATLPVYIDSTESYRVMGILPVDYYTLVADRSVLSYNCNGASYGTLVNTSKVVGIISFPNASVAPYYANLSLTVNGSVLYTATSPLTSTNSIEGKFMLVNAILEYINTVHGSTWNCYWEYYLDHYVQNSFIIVGTADVVTCNLIYSLNTYAGTLTTYTYSTYNGTLPFPNQITKPNGIVSNEDVYDMRNNYYYEKALYEKPRSILQYGSLKVDHNSTFIIKELKIDYIKRPRLINLELNQSCELDKGEEIVALAFQNIVADKALQYQYIALENQSK